MSTGFCFKVRVKLTWRHGVDASEEKLPGMEDGGSQRLMAAQIFLKALERKIEKQTHSDTKPQTKKHFMF